MPAYDSQLADRVRHLLSAETGVEEQDMFGALLFRMRGKMLLAVGGAGMMCRLDADRYREALSQPACRPVVSNGTVYEGYVNVAAAALADETALQHWVGQSLHTAAAEQEADTPAPANDDSADDQPENGGSQTATAQTGTQENPAAQVESEKTESAQSENPAG